MGQRVEETISCRVSASHTEAVKSALSILAGDAYKGANDEFLGTYEHYRHGHHKEAIGSALKALESALKTICEKRGWPIKPNDGASKLIGHASTMDLFQTICGRTSAHYVPYSKAVRRLSETGMQATDREQMSLRFRTILRATRYERNRFLGTRRCCGQYTHEKDSRFTHEKDSRLETRLPHHLDSLNYLVFCGALCVLRVPYVAASSLLHF